MATIGLPDPNVSFRNRASELTHIRDELTGSCHKATSSLYIRAGRAGVPCQRESSRSLFTHRYKDSRHFGADEVLARHSASCDKPWYQP